MSGITEKLNRFGFVVRNEANKIQIKNAVEKLYGVRVENVRTMKYIGKVKSRNTKNGINSGLVGRCKKAINRKFARPLFRARFGPQACQNKYFPDARCVGRGVGEARRACFLGPSA
jgi:large subunit ribosomal protein L23